MIILKIRLLKLKLKISGFINDKLYKYTCNTDNFIIRFLYVSSCNYSLKLLEQVKNI